MRSYYKNMFKERAAVANDGVSLVYHTHIDALDKMPCAALHEFMKLGFVPYNFDTHEGKEDIVMSDLKIRVGSSRSIETSMFVLNSKSNTKQEAQDIARQAGDVMNKYEMSGYIEVERVYGIPLTHKMFDRTKFNEIFLNSANGRDLPVRAIKSPLKPDFCKSSHFSAGEIHLTMPRTIDGRIATHPDLMKALFDVGFYGPDVLKNMNEAPNVALRNTDGSLRQLVDVPMTISAANMRALTQLSNAVIDIINEVGWSADENLTKDYPLGLMYEIMEGHEWFGDVEPEHTYRDVLWTTEFSSDKFKQHILEDYRGTIGGHKLFAPNLG